MAAGVRPAILGADPDAPFPPATQALREPDGLLAIGGDLSPQRLLAAYRGGIFPWYSDGQPILWWSPDPRGVFVTGDLHLSTRFRRSLRRSRWTVRADTRFGDVVAACAAAPRPGQDGTWITDAMQAAYLRLHALGHAHSVEVLDGERLVGGIYGVAVGRMFYGESMFSAESGGSKVALAALARHLAGRGWPLIDAQMPTAHLERLGAQSWRRARFLDAITPLVESCEPAGTWRERFGEQAARDLAG
ncbi:leucyl/phenylalanyl-tRNA--protein transferase [Luteimonas yindakuii]|uniref:Leucyl/phenylalanyl-tRNA--protein transferase n=1 Tax=Luteimonas yindakuii TaxID=2565782 RepID=A0A4Z1RIT5_9GAMM|nr:leucyl/phenylalanyl-tRNA--protein transferase [Luteimonas yindakuii]TKS54009.1 leucyl/phenylalanyl-tRNA--protein transferase [Luteimonas yindakuii]